VLAGVIVVRGECARTVPMAGMARKGSDNAAPMVAVLWG
jgi:hypothetical protein